MSRKVKPMPAPKKSSKAPLPNLPQHDLPDPYSRLQTLGKGDFPEVYDTVTRTLMEGDRNDAAHRLLQMVQDETYYDYDADYYEPGSPGDVRSWTRLHALRVLMRLGEAAQIGIEPLLSLLDEEDDYLREEVPFYYAAMGQPAIEPLARVVQDTGRDEYRRTGASESLAEIGEAHPELRDAVVAILEQALMMEQEEDWVAGCLICNLLDLSARESLPIIEQAFAEERVDESLVSLADVQEHFGLPVTAASPRWLPLPEADEDEDFEEPQFVGAAEEEEEEDEDEGPRPYVAPAKIGRNEPCPCGSGKKYKKCCGAGV